MGVNTIILRVDSVNVECAREFAEMCVLFECLPFRLHKKYAANVFIWFVICVECAQILIVHYYNVEST